MKLLILLFLTNIAHATYDPSLQNLQLDMMYSAKVSSAGVVSEESKDFINGNCVASGTGSATFTCTFNTGIFTVTPNCVAASSTQGWAATVSTSTTASQAVVQTEYIVVPAANADSFKVSCQKQGVDYLTASSAVYSVQNQNTDMVSYSPNVSSPGILTNSGKWRRVGDMMEIEVFVEWNGSGGGGGLLIDIPSGYTIDTAKLANVTSSRVGGGQWLDSGTAYYDVSVLYSDTNSLKFMQTSGTAYLDGSAFASGDQMKFNAIVPITGWKTAPFAIASYLGVGVLYTGAPATGTLNSSFNTVTFGTKVFDSATSSYSGGTYTVPVNGLYDISAQVQVNSTLTAGQNVLLGIHVDGVLKYAASASAHGSISNINPSVKAGSIPLLAGQLVTIKCLTEGTSNSFSSTAGYSFLSITRTGSY